MRRTLLSLFLLVAVLAPAACAQSPEPPAPARPAAAARLDTTRLTWHPSLEAALAASAASGKKVLIDIYAPWCPWCRRLQRETYPEDRVLALIQQHFEPVRLNGEINDDTLRFQGYTISSGMLARALGTQGYPTVAFLDPTGRKITHVPGFTEAPEFARVLRYIGSDAFRDQTFEQFTAADSANAPAPAPLRTRAQ